MCFLQFPSLYRIFLETFSITGRLLRRAVKFALEHKKFYIRRKRTEGMEINFE